MIYYLSCHQDNNRKGVRSQDTIDRQINMISDHYDGSSQEDTNVLCWGVRLIFHEQVDSELSLKDEDEPEKWRRDRISPQVGGRDALAWDLLRAQFLWDRAVRFNHLRGGVGDTHGAAGGGGGEADVRPQQCRSLQWDRHSAPAHGCQVRNWDLWLPDSLIFFPEKMESWISMQNLTILKCL